jgi:predicted AAA+ superfamily ATPase
MEKYQKRLIDKQINRKLAALGGIVLEGARGVGKSTTARHYAASYVSLDETPQILDMARVMPKNILTGKTPRAIDEWQLAPELWNTIRHEIDFRHTKNQFILTGSAAPADDITRHSGAGRFARVRMRPLSLAEMGRSTQQVSFGALFKKSRPVAGRGGLTINDYAKLLVIGGMPAIFNSTEKKANIFYEAYLENIIRTELKQLEISSNPLRMRALINALSRNIATQASLETLAQEVDIDTGLSTKTIRAYLDRLSQIFLLEELPAWRTHLRSGIQMRVKPKWYFMDPAIAAAAIGVSAKALLNDLNTFGLFFEAMVLRDIRVYADSLNGKTFFYRDSTGLEIDIIVQINTGQWAAFEVKLGGQDNLKKAENNLLRLRKVISGAKLKELMSLNIITAGEYSYTKPNGINILALGHLSA